MAQLRADRHDVVARHHQGLAALRHGAAALEHLGEALPGLRRLVLLAELLRPVAPAARGDAGRQALLHPGSVDRDRRAEAVADHADTPYFRSFQEKVERGARVLDLLQTDRAAARAFALAAAAHVEAQRDVAEAGEEAHHAHYVAGVLGAAETVQHEECRSA